jgi:hypothetical protein
MVGRFVEGILAIFTEATSFIMMCAGRTTQPSPL